MILLAAGYVVAVYLVTSRGYRAEVETAIGGTQVAQRDVGGACKTFNLVLLRDCGYPHTLITRYDAVESAREVIPRQGVYLLAEVKLRGMLPLVAATIVERIDAIGVILNPRQAARIVGGGVEQVAATTYRTRL